MHTDINEMVEFTAKYDWLFNFKVTDFFLDRVWDKAPAEWLETFRKWSTEDLKGIPFGTHQDDWPESLKEFISTCLKFSLPREVDLSLLDPSFVPPNTEKTGQFDNTESGNRTKKTLNGAGNHRSKAGSEMVVQEFEIDSSIRKGMSEKKLHEVCRMGSVVNAVACQSRSDHVIDVGSGLGYLGQVLHNQFQHRVLGLEGKQCHTSGAEQRVKHKTIDSCHGLQNRTCELYQNIQSEAEFIKVISDWLSSLPPGGSHVCSCKSGSPSPQKSSHATQDEQINMNFQHELKNKLCISGDSQITQRDKHRTSSDKHSILDDKQSAVSDKGETLSDKQSEPMSDIRSILSDKQNDLSDKQRAVIDIGHTPSDKQSDSFDEQSAVSDTGQTLNDEQSESMSDIKQSVSFDGQIAGSDNGHAQSDKQSESDNKQSESDNKQGESDNKQSESDDKQSAKCDIRSSPKDKLSAAGAQQCTTTDKQCTMINKQSSHGTQNKTTKSYNNRRDDSYRISDIDKLCIESEMDQQERPAVESSASTLKHSDVPPLSEILAPGCMVGLHAPVCMVGLHCCGDLTPTMLKYFTKMDFIRSLCVVSCCYHRMEYDEDQSKFKNFPLSLQLEKCLTTLNCRYPAFHYTPYSMRLAAQETRARWKQQTEKDHAYHVRNVAYRGLLEMCLVKGPFVLKKTARRITHKKDCDSFDTYLQAVSKQIQIPESEKADVYLKLFEDTMWKLYKENEPYFVYIEPITALQFLLQPVLESLIYLDRFIWLQEQGLQGAIVPIFDEFLSPRNLALIAIKK